MRSQSMLAAAVLGGLAVLLGCRVEQASTGDHVRVETPLGGLQVRTDQKALESGIGLPVYPGAVLNEKQGDNHGAADIDFAVAGFRLRVKAMGYSVAAPANEVQTFYTQQLGRFGDVIACRDGRPAGGSARTREGLTCGEGKYKAEVDTEASAGHDLELKAGSPEHQHVVGIGPGATENQTRFALVVLDLPHSLAAEDAASAR